MRQSLVPAWLVSLLLHVGVVLLLIYVNFGPKLPPPITGVPVTLVTSGPPASVQPEVTPAPQETAPPPASEPIPAPPTPIAPAPAPAKETPKAKPTPPTPAPTKPGKTKPTPPQKTSTPPTPFDPGAAAKAAFGAHTPPARRALPPGLSAGPPRVAPTPAQSGAALKGMVDKMYRLWNLDCTIAGNRNAVVPIHVVVASNGRFSDGPTVMSGGSSLFAGAGASAVRALKAGQPYSTDEVPAEYRNQGLTLNFNAKDACASK